MLVCINATARSPYVEMSLGDGRSAIDMLRERIDCLQNVSGVAVLVRPDDGFSYPEGWRRISVSGGGEKALLEALLTAQSDSEAAQLLLYWHIDGPFLDPVLCSEMVAQHTRYSAEYSFADGYPDGLAPELLAPGVLPRLMLLVQDSAEVGPLPRDALFQVIQRDINSFDIETTLSDHDLRMLRIDLFCDTRRNWVLCKRLHERGAENAAQIVAEIRSDQGLLRTLPAYMILDVVEGSLQEVGYSPYRLFGPAAKGKQREMAVEDVRRVVHELEQFSPGSVVSFGLWGDPGLHSDPVALIEATAPCRLVIETSGVGWDSSVLERAIERSVDRVIWIVHLDAVDKEVYRRVRGDGFEEAMRVSELLQTSLPDNVYIQTVRYADVERHTEQFYRYWKERTSNIIVQKYDHFCGVLEDKRVSDISPVTRHPCWHLKRDLTVLVDGSVPLCREDIYAANIVGNLFRDGIEAVWTALEPYHQKHVDADYPPLCRNCDEYYTFNF